MSRTAMLLLPLFLMALCTWHVGAGGSGSVKVIPLDKLNTDADEEDPHVAADGMTLFYASNKAGTFDLLMSKRVGANQAFAAGKPLIADEKTDERSPFLYKTTLYYAHNEAVEKLTELKNFDIYAKPSMLAAYFVAGVCEKTDELNPWITAAGREFYFSRKIDKDWVLFVAQGPVPGPIGKAAPVGFPKGYHHATLSPTGLTMYLQGPVDGGRTGIYRSKRLKAAAEWSEPEPVTALNTSEGKKGDLSPCLTADGLRLYFASDRDGGKGGLDIWYLLTSQLK